MFETRWYVSNSNSIEIIVHMQKVTDSFAQVYSYPEIWIKE